MVTNLGNNSYASLYTPNLTKDTTSFYYAAFILTGAGCPTRIVTNVSAAVNVYDTPILSNISTTPNTYCVNQAGVSPLVVNASVKNSNGLSNITYQWYRKKDKILSSFNSNNSDSAMIIIDSIKNVIFPLTSIGLSDSNYYVVVAKNANLSCVTKTSNFSGGIYIQPAVAPPVLLGTEKLQNLIFNKRIRLNIFG